MEIAMGETMDAKFKIPRRQIKLSAEETCLKSVGIKVNRRPSGVVRLVNITMVDEPIS
jgi:hypothetical protein